MSNGADLKNIEAAINMELQKLKSMKERNEEEIKRVIAALEGMKALLPPMCWPLGPPYAIHSIGRPRQGK